MAYRYYIMPYHEYTPGKRAPKYLPCRMNPSGDVPGVLEWGAVNQGVEGWSVVAVDASDIAHAALAAMSDVVQIPLNLSATLTVAQRNSARTALANRNLPSAWVTTSLTWRQLLKAVICIFAFYQKMHSLGLREKVVGSGITLSTQFSQLPQGVQDRLQGTAQMMGYAAIPGTMTVEQMLTRLMSDWRFGNWRLGPEDF